jgi:glycerophosphoryl diester phosphodiesterase
MNISHVRRYRLKNTSLLAMTLLAGALPQFASASCGNVATKMAQILNTTHTADSLVLAHRGLWGKYAGIASLPENSRGSLDQADTKCMDGVELDVKVTKDGVPVLMHDFNLGRTTNVWTAFRGGVKYNPANNTGTNTEVSSVNWSTLQDLLLLTPDRSTDTGYHVPRLDELFEYWKKNNMTTPMVFDTKSADAVRAVETAAIKAFPKTAGQVVAVKVNATLYPTAAGFLADAKYITAIPVFTTNMLSKINVHNARVDWEKYVNTLEINVKQENGLLQGQMDLALKESKRVGVFQAIPDGPSDGQFYKNTGECCYRLSDLYFSYSGGGKDTEDNRGDIKYLVKQGFGLITTDDPNAAISYLKNNGKRVSH